jgi:hypothetical protein
MDQQRRVNISARRSSAGGAACGWRHTIHQREYPASAARGSRRIVPARERRLRAIGVVIEREGAIARLADCWQRRFADCFRRIDDQH